uniref:Sestrin homolog n=1 Tax=Dermatophagoides pteronyssinus TaxID=6956 RepID=A0A6P6Y4W8_DERPT|nr:sestrin homolog [Dermatophagoides pteronyssinus]
MSGIQFSQQQKEDFLEKTFTEYIGCHPTYTIPLIRAHNFIMRDIGPINTTIRYYIAIMAASRHRCTFLVQFLREQFLKIGGDSEWLKGLEYAPIKLQSLNMINKILAHQPWLLKTTHIQLLFGQSLTKNINSWTLPELTHAIIIMAHFHSLCSLSFGCRFGYEPPEFNVDEDGGGSGGGAGGGGCDYEEIEIEELRFDNNNCNNNNNNGNIIKKIVKRSPASRLIVERCRQLEQEDANLAKIMNSFTLATANIKSGKHRNQKQQNNNNNKYRNKKHNGNNNNGDDKSTTTTTTMTTTTTTTTTTLSSSPNSDGSIKSESSTNDNSSSSPSPDNDEFHPNTWSDDEWKKYNFNIFIDDPEFCYIDFAKRGRTTDTSTYRIQDYQWDDQGYSLSNYLFPDIASFLDEKFKVGYNLTYYTLGPKTNIDTSPFRRAVWNYIQSIYGIRHDDYNYREVNILLERQLKCYIKHLACFPELTPKHDFRSVMKGFRSSEKVHVIIMVAEARLQAEILYAMRTLMEYMKLSA